MLLTEETAAARKACPVQVFATDIDEDALEVARQGIYPESIAADVRAGPAGAGSLSGKSVATRCLKPSAIPWSSPCRT